MAVTIRDVAIEANVSLGSVSRYLNGYRLREVNMKKIEKAINSLGFKENIIAKGLKNNRSMTIGVMICSITDIFSTSIVAAIEKVLEQANYSIILCNYHGDSQRLSQKLQFLLDRSIDGLIIFPGEPKSSIDLLLKYQNANIPIVLLDKILVGVETDCILADNANASFRAVECLIHSNHRRIAIINGVPNDYVSDERFKGYIDALKTYKIEPDKRFIKYGLFSSSEAYKCMKELMSLSERPTALFITNYYMTLGAMICINELNIKIPDELSIIGFDHFEYTDVIKPVLTVVEQPTEEIGIAAALTILKRIKGDYGGFPEKKYINTRLLLRDSVATINPQSEQL